MSWARPGSAGGALGRPWGPWGGSRKPPYKIHEDLRDSSGKEKLSVAMVESTGCLRYFEWDRSETIFGNFSENVVQNKWAKAKHVRKRSKWRPNPPPKKLRVHDPPPVHPPPLHLCLGPFVLDSSHNLRMIHEGRTIVTILV